MALPTELRGETSARGERSGFAGVTRSFIHANRRDERGYGVVTGSGGHARVDGNVFSGNRHASAADGRATTRYRAHHNLVLSSAPAQDLGNHTHDFDMHGRESSTVLGIDYWQGVAGQETRIERNTFLGQNRYAFRLRGDPCDRAYFLSNVSRQSRGDTVHTNGSESRLDVSGNTFGAADPTARLGVADIDGDGRDDLFLATGTAWYVSLRGATEWRLLNRMPQPLASLRFGDLDGDGRDDVLQATANGLYVSWGGTSSWDKTSPLVASIGDLLVGRFTDAAHADVLVADGRAWRIVRGGRGAAEPLSAATQRASELRVGDFDGDRRTDLFAVVGADWSYYSAARAAFTRLRAAPADGTAIAELVVADLDGDGRADVARNTDSGWASSSGGRGDLLGLGRVGLDLRRLPVGRFDAARGADVLFFGGTGLQIVSSGRGSPVDYSSIELR